MGVSGLFSKRDTSAITYDAVRPLIKWTYVWMIVGLVVTAIVSHFTLTSNVLMNMLVEGNVGILYGALIAEFVLVIALSWAINKLSPPIAALLFLVYAALNGFTLSIFGLVYTGESIALAFVTTAAVFGVMTVFAFTTTVDLLKYQSYLMIGVIGLFIALIVNMFLQSGPFETIISLFGVALFTALTAYDTQKLKNMAASPEFQNNGEMVARYSIFGALQLYLDFINLFIFLLRLLGRRE
jgi:FtsH-binding integral membrane protein